MADYLPKRQGDLDAWEVNFLEHLDDVAAELNIAAEDVARIRASIEAHRGTYKNVVTLRVSLPVATEANVLQWELSEIETRKFVKQLKASNNYTSVIGKKMNMLTSETVNLTTPIRKPVLALSIQGGKMMMKFKKEGLDGIKVFSKRGTEADFVFLARQTSSPFTDDRPNLIAGQPEKREYIAYFMNKDEVIGVASDIAGIII